MIKSPPQENEENQQVDYAEQFRRRRESSGHI